MRSVSNLCGAWTHTFLPLGGFCSYTSEHYHEQTASLQTALLPETYRVAHDMSRTGEPYLKTGEQHGTMYGVR